MTLDGLSRTLHDSAATFSRGSATISRDQCFDVLEGLIGRDPATGRCEHSIAEVRAALSALRNASLTDQDPLSETDFNRLETRLGELETFQRGLDADLASRRGVAGPLGLSASQVFTTPVEGVYHAHRAHMGDDHVLRSGTGRFDMAAMREDFTQFDGERGTWEDRSRCGPTSVIMATLEAGGGDPARLEQLVDALLARVERNGQTHAGQREFLSELRHRLHSGGDITSGDLSRLAEHMLHIHQRAAGEAPGLHGSTDAIIDSMSADAGLATSGSPSATSPRVGLIDWEGNGETDHAVTVGVAADGRHFIWDPMPRYDGSGHEVSQIIYEGTPGYDAYMSRMTPPII